MFARVITAVILGASASMFFFCNDPEDKSPVINPPDTLSYITVIDWGATWCAANDMIAYMHEESYIYPNFDSSGLYVIRSDGTGKQALLYEDYFKGIDWSPDGHWLVVYLLNTIIKISYPGGIIDTLMPSGQFWDPAWAPDGSKILSVIRGGNQRGIHSIQPDGSNYRQIIPY